MESLSGMAQNSIFSSSILEIRRSALKNNLDLLRGLYGKDVRFSSVVKGNAYGHGIEIFASLASELGIDHFSVFDADEAYSIRGLLPKSDTILIMGCMSNDAVEWAVQENVEFFVSHTKRLEQALEAAKKLKVPARIHIELETGMNRTGFVLDELDPVLEKIQQNTEHLHLTGVCTHYAGAERFENFPRIEEQIQSYERGVQLFSENGFSSFLRHSCCSAASIRFPHMLHDMVRIGIMQYGFWSSREVFAEYAERTSTTEDPLERVISWKSRVMDVKVVPEGEYVGYGMSYYASQPSRIAIVPVGYGHGFSRSLSNLGRILIHGERVAVIGMVNMNCLIADITGLEGVEIGDEVVVIGDQGDHTISVSAFSDMSDQLNYESLTRLSDDLPRVIVE
jgi:alanine racemase